MPSYPYPHVLGLGRFAGSVLLCQRFLWSTALALHTNMFETTDIVVR